VTTNSDKNKKSARSFKFWPEVLPGTRRDYFLLLLVIIDIFLILIRNSYEGFIPGNISRGILLFDLFVTILWGLNFLARLSAQKNKIAYIRMHWYEIPGLIPIVFFRTFLLLRGAKLVIAYFKIAMASQEVKKEDVREVNFRFRDVIIDAIADIVFLQSLTRVEEVMRKLDYMEIAHESFQSHHDELTEAVNKSLQTKSLVGEISNLPFMSGLAGRMGEDVSGVIAEVLETKVMGDVLKDITLAILQQMRARVRMLDLERITESKIDDPAGSEDDPA